MAVKGSARLQAKIRAIPSVCRRAGDAAAMETARAVCGAAAILAPVDTGRLRRSIRAEAVPGGAAAVADCPYAAAVELGGASCPPRPFMSPAARDSQAAFAARAADACGGENT